MAGADPSGSTDAIARPRDDRASTRSGTIRRRLAKNNGIRRRCASPPGGRRMARGVDKHVRSWERPSDTAGMIELDWKGAARDDPRGPKVARRKCSRLGSQRGRSRPRSPFVARGLIQRRVVKSRSGIRGPALECENRAHQPTRRMARPGVLALEQQRPSTACAGTAIVRRRISSARLPRLVSRRAVRAAAGRDDTARRRRRSTTP